MSIRIKQLLVCFFALILVQACTNPRAAIYGSWKVQTSVDLLAEGLGDLVFEFRSDGLLRVTINQTTVDFRYEFVDDDTITFLDTGGEIQGILAGQELDFMITGDTLSLISNGETVNFTRLGNP